MFGRTIEKIKNLFCKNEDQIEPNIYKLSKKIGEHKVTVQFAPPKWLSPSEVWFLYYKKFHDTDLDSMLYDWASKKYISIKKNDDNIVVTKVKQLKSEKQYEKRGWDLFFWNENSISHNLYFKNENLDTDFNTIGIMLADYCKNKWWLNYKLKKDGDSNLHIWIFYPVRSCYIFAISLLLVVGIGKYISNIFSDDLWGIVLLFGFILFLYPLIFIICSIIDVRNLSKFKVNKVWSVKLTDEWKKLFADIYWYKYFLERCDEDKYKELCSNDKNFLDKTLPYIIALRLNSCFLRDLSILHYDDMKVVTIWKN